MVDGAGDLGFFIPWSYWPVTLAAAGALAATGLAFYQPWLIALGVLAVIAAAVKALAEQTREATAASAAQLDLLVKAVDAVARLAGR